MLVSASFPAFEVAILPTSSIFLVTPGKAMCSNPFATALGAADAPAFVAVDANLPPKNFATLEPSALLMFFGASSFLASLTLDRNPFGSNFQILLNNFLPKNLASFENNLPSNPPAPLVSLNPSVKAASFVCSNRASANLSSAPSASSSANCACFLYASKRASNFLDRTSS